MTTILYNKFDKKSIALLPRATFPGRIVVVVTQSEANKAVNFLANLFHERITKREQLSNWENQILTDKQKLYAATDAWACIKIYEQLMDLQKTHDFEMIHTDNSIIENI